MYSFQSFLQDLNLNTGVRFNLKLEDGELFYSSIKNAASSDIVSSIITLGNSRVTLEIPKQFENCTSLLKYTIENKYREFFSMREQSLIEILEGKEVVSDKIGKALPFLSKGCTFFIINVDGSRYEALNIIRQLYTEDEVVSFVYDDNIVVMGVFEEINDHAKSMRESIVSDLYCRCYVSYGNIIFNAKDIKNAYTQAKECLILSKNFGIKEEIFYYDKMLFEKIVYNISVEVKGELLSRFKEKFNLFDSELINTIEEFVNCGLNISDAARKLYVHRNTLIYRLDKITKETGFDIRNFKEATVFIIAFLIWKENNL
ncbi:helix-turn-helix domain-containing protein [Clostridium sp. YIM B02515]|uniref:Helix-turn-helix domain-containing protein n=1 Tax=Clostridium rhizosphaerae TaxID=2803861 RepID=A0ABS1TCU7_9CLOT|nr:helix-turn-helix domain-containing protein [Clostridium rhizosphaerae]MBL4936456.1 helix-turn-helix domain-containing protein [Clostridium rhizosphaerae]